jgi:hypothetical protein
LLQRGKEMKPELGDRMSMRPDQRRVNPVATLLIVEVVAFVALLVLFISLVRSASAQFGSAVGWLVLLSFLVAAVALAALFTAVVFGVRRKARTSFERLSREFPDADVVPAYWSAALLQPSFARGPWLQGVGTRGFGVTLVATDEGISFWRPNASEPITSIAASSIEDVKAVTVAAPIGGRPLPALQIDLAESTDRLMKQVQLLPTNEVGTETRDPEHVKQVAALIRGKAGR